VVIRRGVGLVRTQTGQLDRTEHTAGAGAAPGLWWTGRRHPVGVGAASLSLGQSVCSPVLSGSPAGASVAGVSPQASSSTGERG
jgi:hypothetical protein